MRGPSRLLLGSVGLAGLLLLGPTGSAKAQATAPPSPRMQTEHTPGQGAPDWRARMQQNHDAARSIEQQVARLTRDLELTPTQQDKVRELAKVHNVRIQAILDTAPPTLTRQEFTTQVHAISADFHDSVNAMLTPHQLELMTSMLGRMSSGQENRRAP
jgi:Spy/CpxP family protein refolding chaperone